MRVIPFVISTVVTAGLIFGLSKKWGTAPPLGKFLSPQQGFWQNAEPTDKDFSADCKIPGLKGNSEVYFDERLIPHIFSDNDEDAYFIQGYLHARFRLWQMDFLTMATAGRVSEIIGDRAINYDREQRRLGMVYAAENAVTAMKANDTTRNVLDSYVAGVNYYIEHMKASELPVEYKLLDYKPEKWSELKTGLFIKQLTKTLAGYPNCNDLEYTNLLSVFSDKEIQFLFPDRADSLKTIIPNEVVYNPASQIPLAPVRADSIYLHKTDSLALLPTIDNRNTGIGSNNWAVSGSKTASGAPILCNDPHLDLTLPSIWYELQINTPTHNVYGVSLPGIPSLVIGFNDNVAFGLTNGGNDVMDFYEIKFKDESKKQYWFNGEWKDCRIKVETVRVRDHADVLDTVAYTIFGPVMYDQYFSNNASNHKSIAVRWKAHDPSNDMMMWYRLNRATNYEDYVSAIRYLECPIQNVIFASKSGDIAITQQGKMPLRWARQGVYLMPGEDSSYMWQGYIPQEENPHVLNPLRGFVSSANQRAADSSYPYYVPGDYAVYRGWRINQQLSGMNHISAADMMKLQKDNYNSMADMVRPALSKHLDITKLNDSEMKLYRVFADWNLENTNEQNGATIFEVWMDTLSKSVWADEFSKASSTFFPDRSTLIDHLIGDSIFRFADNVNTPAIETINDVVTASFKSACISLLERERTNTLNWGNYNRFTFFHLLQNSVMPFAWANVSAGGGAEIVNAFRKTSGPSWRMVVELAGSTEAFGIYPGGQSGNPGSRYYDNFMADWIKGEYYPLWVMNRSESGDKRIIGKIKFIKG